jgi:hypothetical protein
VAGDALVHGDVSGETFRVNREAGDVEGDHAT